MEKPFFGSTLIQSYIEFDTERGFMRFGVENERFYIEIDEVRTFLTDGGANWVISKGDIFYRFNIEESTGDFLVEQYVSGSWVEAFRVGNQA